MDSLSDLLGNKDFDEPAESRAIKKYVRDTFQTDISVQIRGTGIVLLVRSAALASRLRYDLPSIKRAANTDLRVSIRITN